jgi:ribosome-binding factor A
VTRRQEKVIRVIKETVSDIISNRLSDPRIEGIISVTKVDVSPDLRNADVYLSIMAAKDAARRKTFAAISHAAKHIQTLLGKKMTSKFCPRLHFKEDKHFKETLKTLAMVSQAAKEYENKQEDTEEDPEDIEE